MKDLVKAVLLQVLEGQMLIVPKLSETESHPYKMLHLVDVEDLLDVNGHVDTELPLEVSRRRHEELVVAHGRHHQHAVLLVGAVPAVGPPVTPLLHIHAVSAVAGELPLQAGGEDQPGRVGLRLAAHLSPADVTSQMMSDTLESLWTVQS